MARQSGNTLIIESKEDIIEELDLLDVDEMVKRVQTADVGTEYMLIEKLITFADVPGFGKCCYTTDEKNSDKAYQKEAMEKRADSNYLFYKTMKDVIKYETVNKKEKKFFNQTKQTNIHMPLEFYTFIGRKNSRDEKGYNINSGNVHCYIVNSTVKETFTEDITNETFEKLNRKKKAKGYKLDEGELTRCSVHVAALGIGTKQDDLFFAIRGNVFATDKICVLLEKDKLEINVFFFFFRNPIFYQLNSMMMNSYLIKAFEKATREKEPEESRKGQAKWRNDLASLAIAQGDEEIDYVTCPFTLINVRYPSKEATLLRASHIKAYAKCKGKDNKIDISEAYDPNNGFLVTANIDALFDKYLITVEKDTGKIMWSKAVSTELKDALKLPVEKIEKKYFEDKKKYLKIHNEEFYRLEAKR